MAYFRLDMRLILCAFLSVLSSSAASAGTYRCWETVELIPYDHEWRGLSYNSLKRFFLGLYNYSDFHEYSFDLEVDGDKVVLHERSGNSFEFNCRKVDYLIVCEVRRKPLALRSQQPKLKLITYSNFRGVHINAGTYGYFRGVDFTCKDH